MIRENCWSGGGRRQSGVSIRKRSVIGDTPSKSYSKGSKECVAGRDMGQEKDFVSVSLFFRWEK